MGEGLAEAYEKAWASPRHQPYQLATQGAPGAIPAGKILKGADIGVNALREGIKGAAGRSAAALEGRRRYPHPV